VPCILLHRTVNIYFGNPDFGSFISSPLAFIWSIFSRSPQIVVACPSKSNGGSFLRGLWASGVSSSSLLFSSRMFSPRVNRSLPRVLPRSTVVVHFGAPALHAYHPRALKCQSTWQSSVQICGALVSHDTWHPSGDDMWHSVQAPLGISSACFQVTRVTSLFMTCQHSDVRPPRQIILREVFLFSAKVAPSPSTVRMTLKLAGG
jgi:hypothetical protein